MLLSIRHSLEGWGALGWYGHVMIVGSMAFFYGGGAAWCQRLQKKRVERLGGVGAKINGNGHELGQKAVNGSGTTPVTPGAGILPPLHFAEKKEL